LGQQKENQEHLKTAQQYFQMVGASASECDTIPGRQCMSSCFFLLKQFEDVLVFLNVRRFRAALAKDPQHVSYNIDLLVWCIVMLCMPSYSFCLTSEHAIKLHAYKLRTSFLEPPHSM
jgi:hypothetical protein